MGACVSTHPKPSPMKIPSSFESSIKPDDHFIIPSSPTKQIPHFINPQIAVKPQPPHNSRDFDSKEETFFDSQAWLESDCESDFMSVNGEFTPSRGSTPVHHRFSTGANTGPLFSPPQPIKKVRLCDLFRQSRRVDNHLDDENFEPNTDKTTPEATTATQNGQTAPAEGCINPKKERWGVSAHSCFPRLLSSCRPVTPQQTEQRRT